jgi:hypothetical protein
MAETTTMPAPRRSPRLAAALSFMAPGLGQLYNGERAKGLAVLCVALGAWAGVALATVGPQALRSPLTVGCLGLAYAALWIPAVADAHRRASGRPSRLLSGERVWYVVVMLLTVGPMALPLLWQSPRFSRAAKIAWTAAVLFVALLFLATAFLAGEALQRLLEARPAAG